MVALRLKTIVLLSLVAATVTGCSVFYPTPRHINRGVDATGEPLWVRVQHQNVTWVAKEKVAQVVHRDSSGQEIGSSEVYEDRVRSETITNWYLMQGDRQIDDEDFYRIAGAENLLAETQEYREQGLLLNRFGRASILTGAAAFLGSAFIPSKFETARYTVSSAGFLLAVTGWYLARMGAARFRPETHPVDFDRAVNAADVYNRAQGLAAEPVAEQAEANDKRVLFSLTREF